MRKLLMTVATLAILPFAANAGDMGKSYFSVRGEANFGSSSEFTAVDVDTLDSGKADYNSGFGGGIAIGHYPTDFIRTELALDARHTDMKHPVVNGTALSQDDFATNIAAGMVNIYFDMMQDQQFSPYLGGGVGLAHEMEDGENAFAYQLMAGLNFKIFPEGTLYGGYKYFGTSNFKSGFNDAALGRVNTKANIRDHIVEVGYRFTF